MSDIREPRRLKGACLCGRLAYEVEDAFLYALFCHCSLCRRSTGSAFKALAGIERDKLALVQGEDAILTYGDAVWHNVNCRVCGALVYSVVGDGTRLHVPMGTLAEDPAIRPSMHVFVGSKAPWYAITDDLPQFAGAPPARGPN